MDSETETISGKEFELVLKKLKRMGSRLFDFKNGKSCSLTGITSGLIDGAIEFKYERYSYEDFSKTKTNVKVVSDSFSLFASYEIVNMDEYEGEGYLRSLAILNDVQKQYGDPKWGPHTHYLVYCMDKLIEMKYLKKERPQSLFDGDL